METKTVRGYLECDVIFCVRENGRYNYHHSVQVGKTFGEWDQYSKIVRSHDVDRSPEETVFSYEFVDRNLNWKSIGTALVSYGFDNVATDFVVFDHNGQELFRGKELWEELENGELFFAMFEALDRDSMW